MMNFTWIISLSCWKYCVCTLNFRATNCLLLWFWKLGELYQFQWAQFHPVHCQKELQPPQQDCSLCLGNSLCQNGRQDDEPKEQNCSYNSNVQMFSNYTECQVDFLSATAGLNCWIRMNYWRQPPIWWRGKIGEKRQFVEDCCLFGRSGQAGGDSLYIGKG